MEQATEVKMVVADYANPAHGSAMLALMNTYADELVDDKREPFNESLIEALGKRSYAFTILCYVDGEIAGLANCFESFSTFQGQPLINIHDFVVASAFRGRNISEALMAEIESHARQRQCCRITLEVLEGNDIAQHVYRKHGFGPYRLDDINGSALFWQKSLC
ncbi:hypothetical protein ABT56_11670 [Photobacterium aquae]|uniref:N-acetyltransferase domain-containing protein n=1 Tax=Photobacterium aquae TaxID=1195763 RepID=A0A0J1JSY0_9GAMM|nr:GNAT family N-acetyltransferase [Photobacterium aquae]KLV05372.1 hypothetical protein ABT56_11670 [Photobacterium aquae]